MTPSVVDELEAVEIEIEDCEFGAVASRLFQAFCDLLAELEPIEQARQRIAHGKLRNPRFGRAPLGYVLMRPDPASVVQPLLALHDEAAVFQMHISDDAAVGLLDRLLDTPATSVALQLRQQVVAGDAGRQILLAHGVHLGVSPVANDQKAARVEHRHALHDVFEGVAHLFVVRVCLLFEP